MTIGNVRLWWRWWRLLCRMMFILPYRGRAFRTDRVPVEGGVLLLANHQSYLDPLFSALALSREVSFMARASLFGNFAFSWLIRSVNAFPVKRGAADVGAIKETLRRLKAGRAVLLFPEGTRTRDGSIGPMEQGVAVLAKRARVPIVPVLVDGAFEAWPRGRKLPAIGLPIGVYYGKPIASELVGRMTPQEVVDLVRARLVRMQKTARTAPGRTG